MEEMEDRLRQVEQKVDRHTNQLDHHGGILTDIRDAIKDIQGSLHTLTQIQVEQSQTDRQLDETAKEVRELTRRYDQEVPSIVRWKEKTETLTYRIIAGIVIAGVVGAAGVFFAL